VSSSTASAGSRASSPAGTGSVAPDVRRRIVVLEATNPPDGTTRYVDQVVTYAEDDTTFTFLSVRTLLSRRYDVLHVHWPEALVRGRRKVETWSRCVLLAALITLLRVRKVAIVRTLHNVTPHEPGDRIERWALAVLDRATDYVVTINPVTAPPRGRGTYIPHGHYRDRFDQHDRRPQVRGRLLYAGLIRPYKGVDRLVEAFRQLGDADLSLRIVGRPTAELRASIEQAAADDPRITARFEFVPDADLVAEMSEAELVCLPYEELHNSGMMLVALSLDRPVLVPETPATSALAEEAGSGWVHRFSGGLQPDDLAAALRAVRAQEPSGRPRLENRDWRRVAASYGEAFHEALALTGREVRSSR
jgi:beta-1,4-mannosyltransferase